MIRLLLVSRICEWEGRALIPHGVLFVLVGVGLTQVGSARLLRAAVGPLLYYPREDDTAEHEQQGKNELYGFGQCAELIGKVTYKHL